MEDPGTKNPLISQPTTIIERRCLKKLQYDNFQKQKPRFFAYASFYDAIKNCSHEDPTAQEEYIKRL